MCLSGSCDRGAEHATFPTSFPGSGAESPSSRETGRGRKGGRPLARHAAHVRGEPGAKPFVDDLLLGRGFVRSRAAPSLRSIESQPSTQGFVRAARAAAVVGPRPSDDGGPGPFRSPHGAAGRASVGAFACSLAASRGGPSRRTPRVARARGLGWEGRRGAEVERRRPGPLAPCASLSRGGAHAWVGGPPWPVCSLPSFFFRRRRSTSCRVALSLSRALAAGRPAAARHLVSRGPWPPVDQLPPGT